MNDLTLLTEPEVASMLQVSRRILRSLRSQGELGHLRVGRQVRYLAEHVATYIARASETTVAAATRRKHSCPPSATSSRIRTFTERKAA